MKSRSDRARMTVLMPVFNAEKSVGKAIESILGQTLRDFEFLIIDDGSADGSAEVVRSFRDSRIRFLQNDRNLGISGTLNKGIALACSETIARMDADDIAYPERLAAQWDYLEKNESCAMVASAVRAVSPEGNLLAGYDFRSEFVYYNLTFGCWIFHPTVVYRRSAIQELGGYTQFYGEDFTLWSRLLRNHRFHVLPEVLLDYRVLPKSLCREKEREYAVAAKAQVRENLRYFLGENYRIADELVEGLRENFEPFPRAKNPAEAVVGFLRELERIDRAILAKRNVNRQPDSIRKAAAKRRYEAMTYLMRRLPIGKRAEVLVRTGEWRYFARLGKRAMRTRRTENAGARI